MLTIRPNQKAVEFIRAKAAVRPAFVNIGADSKGHGLEEPSAIFWMVKCKASRPVKSGKTRKQETSLWQSCNRKLLRTERSHV